MLRGELGCGHAIQRKAVDAVDRPLELADALAGAEAEVRALRVPPSDDAVAVLDGSFFFLNRSFSLSTRFLQSDRTPVLGDPLHVTLCAN